MPPEQVMRSPSISNSDGTTCDVGKGLAEGRQVLPVERGAALVEQPGVGQHVGAARDAADGDASAREPAEPGEGRRSANVAGLPPAQTNTMSASRSVVRAAIGDDGDAVRGRHRLAARGGVPPAVELLAREQIGGAQRLDRRGIGHQREVRDQQEADGLRAPGSRGAASRRGRRRLSWACAKCQSGGGKCQSAALAVAQDRAMRYSVFSLARQCAHRQPHLEAGLARARAQARLRRGDRRRRRPRARHRLLSRQGARHHQCRGGGEGLSRLRQCRAQHHHRPLELPAARQHPVLRMVDEAVGGAGAGPQLQRHGQPARRAEPLPLRRAARRLCAARQRHAAARRRCRAARPRAGARAGAVPRFRQCALSDPGRAAAAARRHGAA